jgi:hypothetical protein
LAGERSDIATGVAFTTLVNDAGEPIHRLSPGDSAPDQLFPSIRALYARRHLTAFALSEIFVQAISMINSPMHRLRRAANASLPGACAGSSDDAHRVPVGEHHPSPGGRGCL